MIENEQSQSISLYYQDGGSDKVYNATIEKVDDGFLVNFAFGRRGATLQTGTKTTQPVSYEAAKKFFNQLINAKKAKGYTEGEAGTPYIETDKEERISGINCQLLNPIEEQELLAYLENDLYGAQEKMDGNRLLVGSRRNQSKRITDRYFGTYSTTDSFDKQRFCT
jgi:bifunctional non-homologous end joining protein LigD